jgi:hypothetical protein
MRFTAALTVAAMAGVSAAHGGIEHPKNGTAPAYVTEVVTAYTTYCPEPTEITHAGETYTVTEATTLTITNCPGGCTVVKPATSSVVSVCHDCSSTSAVVVPETTETPVETPAAPSETLVEPTHETPAVPAAPYPSANGTIPIEAPAPSGTGAPTESASAPPFEGAAAALSATGAGLLAIFGLVAAL